MAKKLKRRPATYERGQASCMWGFISMFNFRRGPTNQKLLHGSGLPKDKLDMLANPKETDGIILVGKESMASAAVSNTPTVKKRMEDEMFSGQDVKKEMHGQTMNGRRTNRDRSKSCEVLLDDQHGAKILESEWPRPRNLQKRYTRSLDMDEIMEFYQEIQQSNENGVHNLSNQKYPKFEKNLTEAIKIFLRQKLIDRNCMMGDWDHQPSKELKDALQILNRDEELALKHLHGSKSVMVKFIEHGWNADQKNDNDSKLVAQEQPEKGVHCRQCKFFGRKVKSSEKSTSMPTSASQPLSRIVILKPSYRAEDRLDKAQPKRVGSYLFLTEFKRKLKSAMGKDGRSVSADKNSNKCNEHQVKRDEVYKDNVGMKSPRKDHFFIEKMAIPSKPVKNGKMAEQVQACETSMEYETGKYRKQRLSNLYMEAKKHLCDMLNNEHGVVDFSSEKSSERLGRILSLPESTCPHSGSSGRDSEQVTGGLKLCASSKSQNLDAVDHLDQSTIITETHSDMQDHCDMYSKDSNDQPNNDLANSCHSVGDKMSEGGAETLQEEEILVSVENSTTEAVSDPSNAHILRDDRDGVSSEACEKSAYEDIQLPPSPSTSTTPMYEKIEDLEDTSCLPERPSLVSVLELPFTDKDISPASIRRQPHGLPMQPLRIQFEDYEPSSVEQDSRMASCDKEKQSIYKFIESVLLASGLRWDDFYVRAYSLDQLLDPSIYDEVELVFDRLSCDKRLVFDCINEVFTDIYWQCSSSFPGLSIRKPASRGVPDSRSVICEVCEGVQWHLFPPTLPRTLDHIVKKDMSKSGMRMDIQYTTEVVILEISESIFEGLIKEITFSS